MAIGTSRKHKKHIPEDKHEVYEWKSKHEHALFFILYVMDWANLHMIIFEDGLGNSKSRPTFVHYLIMLLFVGYPMLFFQNFIGQYTRKGCLVIGDMLPLAKGLGYSMIIASLEGFILQLYYSAVYLYYLMFAVCNSMPPWMICFEAFYMVNPECFSLSDIDLCPTRSINNFPCFEPGTRLLAPYVFRKIVAFKRTVLPPENPMHYVTLTWFRMITHTINVGLVYLVLIIASTRSFKSMDLALRFSLYFFLACSMSILLVVITQPGAINGFVNIMKAITFSSIFDLEIWAVSFRRVVDGMKLTYGGHYLFGAFMPKENPAPRRAIFLTSIFTLYIFFIFFFYHTFDGFLFYKLSLTTYELNLESEEKIIFVMYPLVLGTLASAYFFSVIYFLLAALINLNSLILKLFVLELTLRSQFDIGEYYLYVRILLSTLGVAATYPLVTVSLAPHIFRRKYELKMASMISVFFQLIIAFIYGMQKLCDDIHFFFHVPVSKFMKTCWLLMPIFYLLVTYFFYTESSSSLQMTTFLIAVGLVMIPFVFCVVYEIFKYIKKKNLMGLLRPVKNFGPPDVELRILRVLYNPRLAVRYQRLKEICHHDCLLQSQAMKQVTSEEITLMRKLIEALRSGKIVADENTSLHLENNKILLNRRLNTLS